MVERWIASSGTTLQVVDGLALLSAPLLNGLYALPSLASSPLLLGDVFVHAHN